MEKQSKIYLSIVGILALAVAIQYARRSYAISYVKKNWDKIDFMQGHPEPTGIPMFGWRSWEYSKTLDNSLNKINLTKTFPFSKLQIFKDEKNNFVVKTLHL